MTFIDFFRWKAVTLCFLGIWLTILTVFLSVAAGFSLAIFAAAVFLAISLIWLLLSFNIEKKRLRLIERLSDQIQQKYLLAELLPKPRDPVEFGYFEVIKEVSRSAVGIAEEAIKDKEDYKSYVESWIHELKTPLTACRLILDNGGDVSKIRRELKRAENLTESILYYARLRTPEKDMKVSRFSLKDTVESAVKSQMDLLIAAGISVSVTGDAQVYSDQKALEFILRQLLINSAKYCPKCHVEISIMPFGINVRDNGVGIPAHELMRVTERGFTGTNGRTRGDSTGMGLYIVKGLCDQLGLKFDMSSKRGAYTLVELTFPYENVRSHND